MLKTISLRNVKRQMKTYAIYVITMSIAFAMLYSFNAFIFSDMFQKLSDLFSSSGDNGAGYIVTFYSIIIIIVVAWLVGYMLNYMLQKRSEEFGTYMLLGLEQKQLAKMYVIENIMVGVLSLIIGSILGILFTNILNVLVTSFYQGSFSFIDTISLKAIGRTVLYFFLIYFILLFLSSIKLKRLKLISLMNYGRYNEAPVLMHRRLGNAIFLCSVLCGIGSIVLLTLQPLSGDYTNLLSGITLILLSHFGIAYSISSIIYNFFGGNRAYHSKDIFVFRVFANKINHTSTLFGIVATLFTLALLLLSTGISYAYSMDKLLSLTNYDLSILHEGDKSSLTQYKEYIEEFSDSQFCYTYNLYTQKNADFMSVRNQTLGNYFNQQSLKITPEEYLFTENQYDMFMSYSDYNELRKSLGYKPLSLNNNRYMIHCLSYLKESLKEYAKDKNLSLSGRQLSFSSIATENFSQYDGYGNGQEVLIIVPDDCIYQMDVVYSLLVSDLNASMNDVFLKKISAKFPSVKIMNLNSVEGYTDDNTSYMTKLSSGKDTDYINGKYIMLSTKAEIPLLLSLCYLGFLLCMTSTVILSIQLISENTINAQRYSTLKLLGMDTIMQTKLLLKQVILYFLFPFIPAVVLGAGVVYIAVSKVVNQYFLVPIIQDVKQVATEIFCFTMLIFIIVYILYSCISYKTAKRDILKNDYDRVRGK